MKLNICLFDKKYNLLEKYTETREKINNSIQKRFYSELAYNRKYVKAKTKSNGRKIKRNFHVVGS